MRERGREKKKEKKFVGQCSLENNAFSVREEKEKKIQLTTSSTYRHSLNFTHFNTEI
jgi:hypothetical protein